MTEPGTQKKYLSDYAPVWCLGCGHFSILASLARTLATLELPREKTVVVSGIGCSGRLPAYLSTYGFHGLHGRALPTAIGLATARPDLRVIAVGGDGDFLSIGGNHFLHAMRRNVPMTCIIMDNEVYGLTKGQASPTTQPEWGDGRMTQKGFGAAPVLPLELALSNGAGFVARSYSGNPKHLKEVLRRAFAYPGFSVVQAMSYCIIFRKELISWKEEMFEVENALCETRLEALNLLYDQGHNGLGIFFEDKSLKPFTAYHTPEVDVDQIASRFAIR